MKPTVYLSGPIADLRWGEATSWRERVAAMLEPDIRTVNPMRGKDELRDLELLTHDAVEERVRADGLFNSDAWAITQRDRHDTITANAVLVNLTYGRGISAGTMIELGWADMARVPIVMVTGGTNTGKTLEKHPIVRGVVGWIVPTEEDGCDVVRELLL